MTTTVNPGEGHRLALLDLTTCYDTGTHIWHNWSAHYSANWPGHFKQWDFYLIVGSSLADLAAHEAEVEAYGMGAGTGAVTSHVIYWSTYAGFTDDALGNFAISPGSNIDSQYAFSDANRYVSLYAKPYFNSVPWYTDDASSIALGVTGAVGSTTACPVETPVADFTASTFDATEGATITFTDLSANDPTSWSWTFGDGGTSTSQNPSHLYATPGTFSVTLTATNSAGSDSETKLAYINIFAAGTPDPESPAGVLLEIYAAAPGSARWDVAKWDEATWGEGGWRDVTPYGITVDITWGSTRPGDGILSVPAAASWAVDYFDPDRILDPANADGPYFGDLQPFLPIRVSHRGVVVRQGYATGISHIYEKDTHNGYMRGTDNISILANAQVPSDTALSNTLYARTVDAIAAAGLSVAVAAPPGGIDPPVTAWATGTREWSVWEWIKDAAQEVLHIPIVDRLGTVTFRPWASPLARGIGVDSTELVGLQVITDYEGLYSVVTARVDPSTIETRALTPPPRYGARTYARDEVTIDADLWAEAVLADRAGNTLRWVPGDIRPLNALRVEQLARLEAVERITMSHTYTDPAVIVSGIVVGGNIFIKGKVQDETGVWRFRYETAQTAPEPLIETGGEPTDYLLRTGGGEYLYPTGGT